jgi:uncharacterized iron-regulated membrane protein
MNIMSDITLPSADAGNKSLAKRFYFAAWRWHFYAGLYVVPFLVMLAVTGLIILWSAALYGRDGEAVAVAVGATPLAVSQQAAAAAAAVSGGTVSQYIAPSSPDRAAAFRVDAGDAATTVIVDPYTGAVLDSFPRQAGWYDFATDIHGTLLLGDFGDRLIEIAASLGIVLIVTGLYLWWPRDGRGVLRALIPDFSARRRPLWKSLHSTVGAWISLVLVAFLLSGLSWAGIWGERYVQAWSTFPAEKWDSVPLSDVTHASMNHGSAKEVPWALEQTPMPASGSQAGAPGTREGAPVTIDTVLEFARANGFDGRLQVAWPAGESGVWTLSRDSMSNDSPDPTSDRTVHIDRYTGRVLADVGYADYSAAGKAMAVGVALHEGDLGLWNLVFNTVFCLSVIFISVSGVAMWWLRRPAGALRLAAPPVPGDLPLWKAAVVVMLAVSFAFPLAGLTLLVVLALDLLLFSRVPAIRNTLN